MRKVILASGPVGAIAEMVWLNPNTGQYQSTPFNAVVGQLTAFGANARNTNTVRQRMQLVFEIMYPDGTKYVITGAAVLVDPGLLFGTGTGMFNLHMAGLWKTEAILKAEIA